MTRPARPRRAASATRAPRTSGGGAGGAPAPEDVRRRQALGLGALAIVLILMVLAVKGCVDSRQERALKDYNRDVASIVESSDDQVSKQLFDVLEGGGAANDVQTAVNQVRTVADDDVSRAKALDPPDDMKPAQRNLELVLNLRAEGVQKIAALLPTALSDQPSAQEAQEKVAGQMQAFLASDVVYSQRVAPLIKEALDKNDIAGQSIAQSQFLPSIGWLDPAQVADRLGAQGGGTSESPSGEPAPGLHGHGLVSVEAGGVTLAPGEQNVNRIPAGADVVFDVTFANQGENDETNVNVTVKITGAGNPITVRKRVNQTKAGENAQVSIPLGKTPPVGRPVTITVTVAKVPGEEKTDNNTQSYTALFTR